MHKISKSINRSDAQGKCSGSAKYIADIKLPGMYNMSVLASKVQHAEILNIKKPQLPDGYVYVDGSCYKGMNYATIVAQDWQFFADKKIDFYGQAILGVAGPDLKICEECCSRVEVEYKELPSISDIEDATECFNDFIIIKGDPDKAFAEADKVYEGSFSTGIQEQAYMETQGFIAEYEDDKLTVTGSMQCPYYVKNSLMNAFALDEEHVRVVQCTTGGAFGGKEDYPSIIAGQAGAAAMLTGHPVRMVLDRREDMAITPKRHPSLINFKTAVDKNGEILAMDIDCKIDAGAYETLSRVVLERTIFVSTGAYNIENIRVRGRTMKTNHVPSGAFRGFGGPQAIFGAEMNMYNLAKQMSVNPFELKKKYLFKKGDLSVTSGVIFDEIKFDEMIDIAEKASGYSKKWLEYENAKSTDKLKGIGISFSAHGGGFTGSGEQDIIKALVRVVAEKADTASGYIIKILLSNVEMGQGVSITMRKIVSEGTGIPFEDVIYAQPDTDNVPDSGPTVASRTIMIVGKLVLDAAIELKDKLDGKTERITVERRYKQPDELEWDQEKFKGNAYPSYSWSINVVEVEVDPISYQIEITGSWAVYDIGTAIDLKILTGQMQGGTAQAFGYSTIENMVVKDGRIAQGSFTDYAIPTSLDFPDTECFFIDNPYKNGPFGAKAAGELPNEGPAGAVAAAVSQAVKKVIPYIPITPEKLEEELR